LHFAIRLVKESFSGGSNVGALVESCPYLVHGFLVREIPGSKNLLNPPTNGGVVRRCFVVFFRAVFQVEKSLE
jgi:hypothetical protein